MHIIYLHSSWSASAQTSLSASHSSGNGLHQRGGRMHLCNNTTSPCSLRVQPTSQCYRQHCIDTYHPHYQDITLNQHHHQHFLLPALYEFNLSSSLLIRIILTIKVIKLNQHLYHHFLFLALNSCQCHRHQPCHQHPVNIFLNLILIIIIVIKIILNRRTMWQTQRSPTSLQSKLARWAFSGFRVAGRSPTMGWSI